jgi:hypothetical protein
MAHIWLWAVLALALSMLAVVWLSYYEIAGKNT